MLRSHISLITHTLDGAGVDVLQQSFWAEALPQQDNIWCVIPTGRTSWVGERRRYSGPMSTLSAGIGLARPKCSRRLELIGRIGHHPRSEFELEFMEAESVCPRRCYWTLQWRSGRMVPSLAFSRQSRGRYVGVVRTGYQIDIHCPHPVIAAAGYIKSQAYVPLTMSRSVAVNLAPGSC